MVPHPPPAVALERAHGPAEKPVDAVEVGRILGAWGVKGGLKLKPFASQPQALLAARQWYIEPGDAPDALRRPLPAAATQVFKGAALLRISQVRGQGEHIVATTPDVNDRDVAQALAGWRVFVSRASFPAPEEGEFYWVDLIGLDVVNRDGVPLGRVGGLIETGPHCVLQLPGVQPGDEERLIPFVDAYVDSVDLAGRVIRVDWDPSF